MTANHADLEGSHEQLWADHDTATDYEHEPPTQPLPWIPQPIDNGWRAHLDRMDAAADARHADRFAPRCVWRDDHCQHGAAIDDRDTDFDQLTRRFVCGRIERRTA